MKILRISTLCILLSSLLLLYGMPPALMSGAASSQTDGSEKAAAAPPPDGAENNQFLFPGLRDKRIRSVSVSTPDRSFEFRCDSEKDVSVNGHLADEEIFCTLVSQIEEFPVDDAQAFAPERTPMLTLVVFTTDGEQHTARFYPGGDSGAQANIASGPADAPAYHRTEAWRVGTLMMTCEGTRIQDASGNEIPVN